MKWNRRQARRGAISACGRHAATQDKLFDSRVFVSEGSENLTRMLADFRRHYGFLLRHALHIDRVVDGRDGPESWVIDLGENAVGRHLRIGGHLIHRRNRSPDYALLAEE